MNKQILKEEDILDYGFSNIDFWWDIYNEMHERVNNKIKEDKDNE